MCHFGDTIVLTNVGGFFYGGNLFPALSKVFVSCLSLSFLIRVHRSKSDTHTNTLAQIQSAISPTPNIVNPSFDDYTWGVYVYLYLSSFWRCAR